MKKEEREVLEKFHNYHSGLLSPMEYFNLMSDRNNKISHSLISQAYVEEVPTIKNDTHYTFYRLTEKAQRLFYPFYKRWWCVVRQDLRTVLIALVTALLVSLIT